MTISPPPVPSRLREMLKDYPDHIARLQKMIADIAGDPKAWQPYERVIWLFEDFAGSFFEDARAELNAAKESGDPTLISKAEAKQKLMGGILLRKPWFGDKEFEDYFSS